MDPNDAPNPPPAGDPPPPPPPDDKGKPGPNSTAKTATVTDTKSVADGKGTDALGDQVHPATQTSEADGHRTLANPVTDPGPYVGNGMPNVKHPDRKEGQHRYNEANEPFKVIQRTSTGHDKGFARPDGDTHEIVDMAPDLAVNGAASDSYHPVGGKTLTEQAQQLATQPRDPAPVTN